MRFWLLWTAKRPLDSNPSARIDYYMHLADLKSYLEADDRLCALYANPDQWAR